jgi:hypothetical protein
MVGFDGARFALAGGLVTIVACLDDRAAYRLHACGQDVWWGAG